MPRQKRPHNLKDAIHFKSKLRYLVPSELETRLAGTNLFTKTHGGWSPSAKTKGIFIDLSRVEWVDLGALIQLILLTEAALRAKIQVDISLPLPYPRSSEKAWMEKISSESEKQRVMERVQYRAKALRFLNYIRLKDVLRFEHIPSAQKNLHVLQGFDSSQMTDEIDLYHSYSTSHEDDLSLGELYENRPSYKYIFPLTWISVHKQDDIIYRLAKFLSKIVGEPERGIETLDADSIANVLFIELAQNVAEHAEVDSWALIGAWVRQPKPNFGYIDPNHYHDYERSYLSWLNEIQPSLVNIVIGDSGIGIPATLTTKYEKYIKSVRDIPEYAKDNKIANMLFWAFDRWSSCKKDDTLRGTRGLYRVDRIVKKYQGLFTLRCENQSVGLDHGGPEYDERINNKKRLPFLPGTLVRLWLPSSKEQLPLRKVSPKKPKDLTLFSLELGKLTPTGLSDKDQGKLLNYFQMAADDKPLCLLITAQDQVINRGSAIEYLLKNFVEARHPATIVLYGLPGGWDTIENAVDSINQEHEKSKHGKESYGPDHFEIWDPILILGRPGTFVWAGADAIHRKILNKLLKAKNNIINKKDLQKDIKDNQIRQFVWRDFRNDTNLIRCLPDDGLELRLNLDGIFSANRLHIGHQIENHINLSKKGASEKGVYLTPSLTIINRWLNVNTILEETCGPKLAMLLLANLIVQHENLSKSNNKPNFIFFDSTVSLKCQEYLKDYLRIQDSDINLGETGPSFFDEFHIIPSNKFVVVHCDIIVSGDAVERSLYQTYRDDASVVAVSCIVDGRKNPSEFIQVWGKNVPVISIVNIDMFSDTAEKGEKPIIINPITLEAEQIEISTRHEHFEDNHTGQLSTAELNQLIKKYDALHLNHIGRPIGRHFTFYFDATEIAEDHEVVNKFNTAIDHWLSTELPQMNYDKPEFIEVWYPSPEPKPPAPARKLVEQIVLARKDVKATKPIRRVPAYGRWTLGASKTYRVSVPDVVIIDWGALTGSTIMQMIRIAEQAGAKSIYVCIFLCQLQEEEEYFLNHLKSFQSDFKEPSQLKLSGFDLEPKLKSKTRDNYKEIIPIKVNFLSRITLRAYRSSSCPICNQIKRYQKKYYPTSLLEKLAQDQREKLHRRDRGIVIEQKPCNFEGKEHNTEELIWMKDFQHKLELALSSTYRRKEVHDFIESTLEGIAKEEVECSVEAAYFIHLLSVEQHWLKTSPLKLSRTKQLLSELCLSIITSDKDIEEIYKVRAIIVLSTSNIVFLARTFKKIFLSIINFEDCLKQLFYELFNCESQVFSKNFEAVQTFDILLSDLKLLNKEIKGGTIHLPVQYYSTIDVLHNRFEHDHAVSKARLLQPSKAWNDLREEYQNIYSTRHNQLATSMRLVLPGMEADFIDNLIKNNEALDRGVEAWIKRLKDNWHPCRCFIDNNIFPKLRRFKDVLKSSDARNELGPHTTDKLKDMLVRRIPIGESDFSQLISKFANYPNSILDKANWHTFKTEAAWIWYTFLKPPKEEGVGSTMLEFLKSAPAEIGSTFCAVYDEVKLTENGCDFQNSMSGRNRSVRYLGPHEIVNLDALRSANFKVFCTKDLLVETFRELLLNCEKHRDRDNEGQMIIFVEVKKEKEHITFRICNSRSIDKRAGKGLDLLEQRLLPFGAKIEKRNNRPDNLKYSFEVIVKFQDGGIS